MENLAGWMSQVVSGILTLGRRWGMEWRAKVRVQNGGRARVNKPRRAVLAEMKQNLHC